MKKLWNFINNLWLWIIPVLGLLIACGALYNYATFSETKDLTQISGQFANYVEGTGKDSPDTIYLENGESYNLYSIDGSYFDRNSFNKNARPGQPITMLFDSQDKSIMMIKVGNKTYLSLKDAYRSEKSNANAGLYVGIGMLILSIGMVLILLWLSS
jgi:hypothetical protein